MEKTLENSCELLYHGTSLTGIKGDFIRLDHNYVGVGSNILTLGNAFYSTPQLEIAKLFSHVSEQVRNLRNKDIDPLEALKGAEDAGLGKIYRIKLNEANILDTSMPMNKAEAFDLFDMLGVPENIKGLYKQKSQMGFDMIADIIWRFAHTEGNPYECLCKALGYDGIRIREEAWKAWDYYPAEIGVDWKACFDWPPITVAIYNTDKIHSFQECAMPRNRDLQRLEHKQVPKKDSGKRKTHGI